MPRNGSALLCQQIGKPAASPLPALEGEQKGVMQGLLQIGLVWEKPSRFRQEARSTSGFQTLPKDAAKRTEGIYTPRKFLKRGCRREGWNP